MGCGGIAPRQLLAIGSAGSTGSTGWSRERGGLLATGSAGYLLYQLSWQVALLAGLGRLLGMGVYWLLALLATGSTGSPGYWLYWLVWGESPSPTLPPDQPVEPIASRASKASTQ